MYSTAYHFSCSPDAQLGTLSFFPLTEAHILSWPATDAGLHIEPSAWHSLACRSSVGPVSCFQLFNACPFQLQASFHYIMSACGASVLLSKTLPGVRGGAGMVICICACICMSCQASVPKSWLAPCQCHAFMHQQLDCALGNLAAKSIIFSVRGEHDFIRQHHFPGRPNN